MKCVECGGKAIHYPVTGYFGEASPMCAFCFHGVKAEVAVEVEGCKECMEEVERV